MIDCPEPSNPAVIVEEIVDYYQHFYIMFVMLHDGSILYRIDTRDDKNLAQVYSIHAAYLWIQEHAAYH